MSRPFSQRTSGTIRSYVPDATAQPSGFRLGSGASLKPPFGGSRCLHPCAYLHGGGWHTEHASYLPQTSDRCFAIADLLRYWQPQTWYFVPVSVT
jgi:hypothetical protein